MLKILLLSIFVLFNNVYNVQASHPQVAADLEKIRLASTDTVQMFMSRLIPYDNRIKELDDLKSRLNSLTSETTDVSTSTEQETKRISEEITKLRTSLSQDYRQDRELRNFLDRYKSDLEELSKTLNFIYTHELSSCALMCDGQIALLGGSSISARCLLQNNIEASNACLISILQSLEKMKSMNSPYNQNLNPRKDALDMATIKSLIRRI